MARLILLSFSVSCIATTALSQSFTESALPIVVVGLADSEIPDEPKTTTSFEIIYNGEGVVNRLGGPTQDYSGLAAIEKRGKSSLHLFPKVGYGIELRTANDADTSASILNMPREEDWVLHGPYSDKSLIRNALAYTLAGEMMAYAPRTRFVELVLGDDYRGVYLLTEKIKRDNDRVDISRLTEDDTSGDALTGGYILKFDKTDGVSNEDFQLPQVNLLHARPSKLLFHYPKPRDIQPEQATYIIGFMREFERRLAASDFDDPQAGYLPLVDIESFVDFFIINEISRNVDGYRLSTYLYKDRVEEDGRLKMGPVWDFNLAFGNANYCNAFYVSGYSANFNEVCPGDFYYAPFWWPRLMESVHFKHALEQRYSSLRNGGILTTPALHQRIDSLSQAIGHDAIQRNFARWSILGNYVWPNPQVGPTYSSEVAYLKNWVHDRMEWLDNNLPTLVSNSTSPSAAATAPLVVAPNPSSADPILQGLVAADFPLTVRFVDLTGRQQPLQRVEGAQDISWPSSSGFYYIELVTNQQVVYALPWARISD